MPLLALVLGSFVAARVVEGMASVGRPRFGAEGVGPMPDETATVYVFPGVARRHLQVEVDGVVTEDTWLTEDLAVMGAAMLPFAWGAQVRFIGDGRTTPIFVVGASTVEVVPLEDNRLAVVLAQWDTFGADAPAMSSGPALGPVHASEMVPLRIQLEMGWPRWVPGSWRHVQLEVDGEVVAEEWSGASNASSLHFDVPSGARVRVRVDDRATPLVVVGRRGLDVVPVFTHAGDRRWAVAER